MNCCGEAPAADLQASDCRFLCATPSVLELYFGLVGLPFSFHFFVASNNSSTFLEVAAHLLHATFDPVIIYGCAGAFFVIHGSFLFMR